MPEKDPHSKPNQRRLLQPKLSHVMPAGAGRSPRPPPPPPRPPPPPPPRTRRASPPSRCAWTSTSRAATSSGGARARSWRTRRSRLSGDSRADVGAHHHNAPATFKSVYSGKAPAPRHQRPCLFSGIAAMAERAGAGARSTDRAQLQLAASGRGARARTAAPRRAQASCQRGWRRACVLARTLRSMVRPLITAPITALGSVGRR